jgi:hypothetical protein
MCLNNWFRLIKILKLIIIWLKTNNNKVNIIIIKDNN